MSERSEKNTPSNADVDATNWHSGGRVPAADEELYAALVNSLDGIVWEAESETFQFLFVSGQAEKILGYPAEQWLREPDFWRQHTHSDDADWCAEFCLDATANRRDHEFEYRMIAADGHVVWLHDIVSVKVAADGSVRLRGIMIDITERKRVEQSLEERLRFETLVTELSAAFANLPSGRVDQEIDKWLRRLVEFLGIDRATFSHFDESGTTLFRGHTYTIPGIPPQSLTTVSAQFPYIAEQLRQGNLVNWPRIPEDLPEEATSEREHAFRIGVKSALSLPVSIGGRVVCGLSFTSLRAYRDWPDELVTRLRLVGEVFANAFVRQRADQALRDSEKRYRVIFEGTAHGIALVGKDGRVIESNPALQQMLGYSAEDLRRMVFTEYTHPDDAALDWELFQRICQGKLDHYQVEKRYLHKDGSFVWGELTGSAVRDAAGNPHFLVGMLEDITARKAAEEALRASEERYRSLVAATAQVVWVADPTGRVDDMPQWRALTGQTVDEVKGWGWLDALHPEDRDGTVKDCDTAIRTKSVFTTTYRVRVSDGSYRHFAARGVPILDRQGNIREWVGADTDITERVRAEEALRQAEEELRQSQKLEAVGRLAGGVAHDFNNLLTAITGYSELMSHRLESDDPLQKYINEVVKAADRAASLTRQLLAFSRRQVLQPKVIDLNRVIEDSSKMLRRLIGEDIDLRTRLHPGLGPVLADPAQVDQVVMNLVVNARDAMPRGGKITIETTNVYLDDEYAGRHSSVKPGHYVMLAVSDTGTGMDEGTQARIFEPFFTTKEQGKGTGLGLSTVYGIVQQSSGTILVYSEVGKGTSFKIYLPRVGAEADTESVTAEGSGPARGWETVLLAEDDEILRRLAREILILHGYNVLAAADGSEALRVCAQYGETIHLLLTDVVMPGVSGRELESRVKELHPESKTLFISGYTDDAIIHHGVLYENIAFLQKPFTPPTLLQKVREVLDA